MRVNFSCNALGLTTANLEKAQLAFVVSIYARGRVIFPSNFQTIRIQFSCRDALHLFKFIFDYAVLGCAYNLDFGFEIDAVIRDFIVKNENFR